jgi:hypothetical protein
MATRASSSDYSAESEAQSWREAAHPGMSGDSTSWEVGVTSGGSSRRYPAELRERAAGGFSLVPKWRVIKG